MLCDQLVPVQRVLQHQLRHRQIQKWQLLGSDQRVHLQRLLQRQLWQRNLPLRLVLRNH